MELPTALSQRAQTLLNSPRFQLIPPTQPHGERQYDDGRVFWWKGGETCEGIGYQGPWSSAHRVLFEAAGVLLEKRPWARWQELSAREMEFFLRDKNSQVALPEEFILEFTQTWQELQAVIAQWLQSGVSLRPYSYALGAPFKELPLKDKIHELKAFFLSDKLAPFFQRGGRLEVLDVVECTVYLALDSVDIPPGAFLDWLQIMASETFQEPSLNLVPEAFPSNEVKKTV